MNLVLIDDDIQFLHEFNTKVTKYAKEIFDNIDIDIALDTSILKENIYSIYFLDIDLIDVNGIDVAQNIKMKNPNAKIIFTTSKNNLVYNAIATQPFYFIRKSELDKDLATAFVLIRSYFSKKAVYTFKYESENVNLSIEDIIYCEINDHLITIYTDSKHYHLYKPMKKLLDEINSPLIVQVNRKQCINLSHIASKKRNSIFLDNSIKVKIGSRFKDSFHDVLAQYIKKGDMYVI